MNSLVYFYSKFTEEFLLLSAAGVFTLLSIYCYHWVIQKRRMGVASSQIPSAVVNSYLHQLINEAEFVRKQLFGMTESQHSFAPSPSLGNSASFTASPAPVSEGHQAISPDLLAKVSSLETSLKDKESLVVNINIEKTKLLEEIVKLKANNSSTSPTGNQNDLAQKIKNLEARLEEYALFEEDLANLKRLQQENTQLKKKLSEMGTAPAPIVVAEKPVLAAVPDVAPEPIVAAPAGIEAPHALDQDAIDKLLNGTSAVAPVIVAAPPPAEAPIEAALAPTADQFENLVDSVETSLEKPKAESAPVEKTIVAASAVVAEANASENTLVAGSGAEPSASLASKTDEELLKEFENLLNS